MSKQNAIKNIDEEIQKLLQKKEKLVEKQERDFMKHLKKSWGAAMVSDPLIFDVVESLKEDVEKKLNELKMNDPEKIESSTNEE